MSRHSGSFSCTTTQAALPAITLCEDGPYLVQLSASAPTRVTAKLSTADHDETFTFDVVGRASFIAIFGALDLSARAASGTSRLTWALAPVTSWSPSHLSLNVLLDAGTYDSDTLPTLKPPDGASSIQIIPRTPADTFTVTLHDGPDTSASYTRADQPSNPIPLGRAGRVTITNVGAVRVVFTIDT